MFGSKENDIKEYLVKEGNPASSSESMIFNFMIIYRYFHVFWAWNPSF